MRLVPPPSGFGDRVTVLRRPVGQRPHQIRQVVAHPGQLVIHLRRNRRVHGPTHEAVALQTPHGQRQHPLRDARHRPLQLTKPAYALGQLDDDEHRPLVTDPVQHLPNTAVLATARDHRLGGRAYESTILYEPASVTATRQALTGAGLPSFQIPMLMSIYAAIAGGFLDNIDSDLRRLLGRPPQPALDAITNALTGRTAKR